MIEVGTHEDALITGSALKAGNAADDPVVEIYFLVGSDTGTAYLYTTEKAWPFTQKKLAACGFNPVDHDYVLSPLNLTKEEGNPIAGRTVRIVVTEEEYKEKLRAKISWIGPSDGGERMAPEDASRFTKALRARLLASRGKPAGQAQSKPKPVTRPAVAFAPDTEDVGF